VEEVQQVAPSNLVLLSHVKEQRMKFVIQTYSIIFHSPGQINSSYLNEGNEYQPVYQVVSSK
jgi:hypothetical protein